MGDSLIWKVLYCAVYNSKENLPRHYISSLRLEARVPWLILSAMWNQRSVFVFIVNWIIFTVFGSCQFVFTEVRKFYLRNRDNLTTVFLQFAIRRCVLVTPYLSSFCVVQKVRKNGNIFGAKTIMPNHPFDLSLSPWDIKHPSII